MSAARPGWPGGPLVLAVVLAAGGASPARGEGGPFFTYEPRIVAPGGSLHVEASRFGSDVPVAGVSLISPSGEFTVLGVVPVVDGAFSASFVVPTGQAPGTHFVFLNDATQRIAINLVGSLFVTPTNRPWFTFSPTTAPRGGTVTVSASGFAGAASALLGLLDPAGKATFLGAAPLAGGGFERDVTLPAGIGPGSYFVFVRDAAQPVFAQNVDGPLTVAAGPPPPTVPVGFYPIGAAVNPVTDRVYVPNGGDDTLSVLDGATGATLAEIPVGRLPCAIAVNPRTNRVYVANVNTHDVTVVDGATDQVVATVPVGRHPCAVGVTPGLNRVFVGNYAGDTVSVIDGTSNTVLATVPVGRGPFGIAANPVTSRVYVANGYDDSASVIDGATAAVVATVGVGRAPDAVGVDPLRNRVYVANFFSNTVSVVDGATNRVIATVPVGKEPDGVAVNFATNRVFVSNYTSNTVSVLDGATLAPIATVPVGITPDGLAVNPVTGRVYVTNSNSGDVSVFQDASSREP